MARHVFIIITFTIVIIITIIIVTIISGQKNVSIIITRIFNITILHRSGAQAIRRHPLPHAPIHCGNGAVDRQIQAGSLLAS